MSYSINNSNLKQFEPMVRNIARQFSNHQDDQEDLMQEGYIGLIEAAKRYDPNTGVRFESYASWWVRKYMRLWMLNNSQIVRLSAKTDDYYKPLTEDIEKPCYEEDGELICYADILTDGITPETDVIRQEETEQMKEVMRQVLSDREQQLIQKIYGFDGKPVPMKEYAEKIEVSYDRVKKMHARSIRKLRKALLRV